MHLLAEKIRRLRFAWNVRPLTEEDFYRLCRRFKITVTEIPLRTNGFYYAMKGRHFIAIDSRIGGAQRTLVMFHELAHYLMHAPDAGVTANFHGVGEITRKEKEADAFALCALLPKPMIESLTPDEIAAETGVPFDIVEKRIALYELHRV